jgi:hypothetical protein
MRSTLQLVALGACFVLLWIAFAHRIEVAGQTLESMIVPLAVLCACGVALAWTSRASLLRSLERASSGEPGPSSERTTGIVVAVLVVTGFLLRIACTGEYGLNSDEAQLVWIGAASTPWEVWAFERINSPHPPAIFFVFHYMLQLSWDLVWLRLPAVIGGTFSIWISYRLARELMGPWAGLAVAWMVAFSPPLMELSRVARNYAPGYAFILLSLFLFVRFLGSGRWRYFAAYTAAATIAMTWHYIFIVVFLSMNLVLAGALLGRRAALSTWLVAGAIQLPFAALMLFLYVEHISILPAQFVDFHEQIYEEMLAFDPWNPLGPLAELWRLLAPGGTRMTLSVLSLLGAGVLALRRSWLALSICVVPLLIATGFAAAGRIPLGATRHSVYLFPFLFILVAASVPELLTGYRRTREALARLTPLLRRLDPREPSPSFAGLATAAACALAVLFGVSSLLDYNGDPNPLSDKSYHGVELVRDYRQVDVERTFEALHDYVGPNDWVLLDFPAAYALRMYLELPPVVFKGQQALNERDIAMVSRPGGVPLRHVHEGIQYYYSRVFEVPYQLGELMVSVRDVRRHYGVELPEKVWLLHSAWSYPFLVRFGVDLRHAKADLRATYETRGMLFGVETRELRRMSRLTPGIDRPRYAGPPQRRVNTRRRK